MAEKDLNELLAKMEPHLQEGEFVFCSINEVTFKSLGIIPQCLFLEDEGLTIIVEKSQADRFALSYKERWALITCKISSDLLSVGFLAAISRGLADAGIAMNPVSGFHHDHLFVPIERAAEAKALLEKLSASSS